MIIFSIMCSTSGKLSIGVPSKERMEWVCMKDDNGLPSQYHQKQCLKKPDVAFLLCHEGLGYKVVVGSLLFSVRALIDAMISC